MKQAIVLPLLFVLFGPCARANIRLPPVLASNMVLQQKAAVKLWGWAAPAEKIYVTTSWNGKVDSVQTGGGATWQLAVQTPAAGGPYTITLKGYNTVVLENVLIGEVWICSGQSNMEMNYNWGLPQMREDLPSAANAAVRFFTVPKSTAPVPQENGEGAWSLCDSNTVKSFSAVAYYFGKKLQAELQVPIGLIHASWSGTPAEVWTPAELVQNDSVLKRAAQKLGPAAGWPVTPGVAYNAMLHPLTRFQVAGAIWYQGESNTGTAGSYRQLFGTMIEAWRQRWAKELPFYYVQLAPFAYGSRNIAALLREAQTKTLSLPKTGMVVTTDIGGDTTDIHPKDKRTVGLRLAALALADAYGRPAGPAKSPQFRSMAVTKEKVQLAFDYAEEGLMQAGQTATGFWVAGEDKVFYPAQAKITGNAVVVWARNVRQPLAVRYAFSNTAAGNVRAKNGLPLAPFRTDDWAVDTSPVK